VVGTEAWPSTTCTRWIGAPRSRGVGGAGMAQPVWRYLRPPVVYSDADLEAHTGRVWPAAYTTSLMVETSIGGHVGQSAPIVCFGLGRLTRPAIRARVSSMAWYSDTRKQAQTHISPNRAAASKDAESAARYGWQIDEQISPQGSMNDAVWVAGGPMGALVAGNHQRDEVIVTYVRTEDWLAGKNEKQQS
jgi:hypothetical protein